MAAHLTPAQARALGLDVPATVRTRPRTTRVALPRARAVSTCHACGATFTTDAAETRHVNDTGHARYTSGVQSATMSDDPTLPGTDPEFHVDQPTDAPAEPDDDDPAE